MHEILSKFTPQNRTTLPGGPPTAPQKGVRVRVRPGARADADADVNVSIIDTQGNNQGATDRREQTVRISDSRPKKGPQPTTTGMQAGAKRRRRISKPRCARALIILRCPIRHNFVNLSLRRHRFSTRRSARKIPAACLFEFDSG